MKHQELFRRAERVLEASCGHPFGRYFDANKEKVTALTNAILSYSALPRFLIMLALECGTQCHYVESIQARDGRGADPLYVDLLKAHWIEEAQHIKSDQLEIARLANTMSADARSAAFDDLLAIGALVDATFVGQAHEEIKTLGRVTGRTFAAGELAALQDTLHRSLSRIFSAVGLTHPRFANVARDLSTDGAAKLGIN